MFLELLKTKMNSIKFCLFKIACYIGKFSRISYCSLIHSTWAACEELGLKVCLTSQCHNYLKDKLFRESAKESWRESQLNHVNQYCNQCCIGILQMQLAREHPIWLWKSNLLYFANRASGRNQLWALLRLATNSILQPHVSQAQGSGTDSTECLRMFSVSRSFSIYNVPRF